MNNINLSTKQTYGSITNRIAELHCAFPTDFDMKVGFGGTEHMWSDRVPYSVCVVYKNWNNKGFDIVGCQRDKTPSSLSLSLIKFSPKTNFLILFQMSGSSDIFTSIIDSDGSKWEVHDYDEVEIIIDNVDIILKFSNKKDWKDKKIFDLNNFLQIK